MQFELDSALLKVIDGAQKAQKAIDSLSPVASKASESVKAISKASESVDNSKVALKYKRCSRKIQDQLFLIDTSIYR